MSKTLEEILSHHSGKENMLGFFRDHPEEFESALKLAAGQDKNLSWRAAWLLSSCMKKNDPRVYKHLDQLIEGLKDKKDGHQRELLKILDQMELNEEQEGRLFDACMSIWAAVDKIPSVRMVAFRFLHKTTEKHPELKNEMDFLTQPHYLESLSPGIRKSLEKLRQ